MSPCTPFLHGRTRRCAVVMHVWIGLCALPAAAQQPAEVRLDTSPAGDEKKVSDTVLARHASERSGNPNASATCPQVDGTT